ncbi:MAG: FAD-linked oxidase C-terminal domain-containing protein [Deltaproteobacteria bacterium]|nr:FAD-linked oxidase C-terminal domain-containing protein [Deltaproteobacteria bacterium]
MDREMPDTREKTLRLALELGRRVGSHKIVDDPDILASYAKDESDAEPRLPDVALRAECEADVLAALELAEKTDVPVTPRGAGTGKSGGAIAAEGGLVLDCTRLNRVVEVSREDLLAVVEPGVVTGQLQALLAGEGLFYPPDPNSLETCTIGGNVAHNAGGPRAFKYGVTRQYVLGLTLGLVGGARLEVGRRTVKGVAGYDLTALLVGSEGTLGAFTRVTLRLLRNPPVMATLLVRFRDEVTAGTAVSRIVAQGLVPRVLELMDGVVVDTLRRAGAGAIPDGTGALLLIEADGPTEADVDDQVTRLAAECESAGAIDVLMAKHAGERDRLWAARRVLSDAIKERARHKVAEDIAVPRSRAAELLMGLRVVGERHKVVVASYGHAGDGNFHVNVLWDDDGFDPKPCLGDIFRLALALKGTITGEHGVGLAKRAYLPWEQSGEVIALQKRLKVAFDPRGLMNPGKIWL